MSEQQPLNRPDEHHGWKLSRASDLERNDFVFIVEGEDDEKKWDDREVLIVRELSVITIELKVPDGG